MRLGASVSAACLTAIGGLNLAGCLSLATQPDEMILSEPEVALPAQFSDRQLVTVETLVNGYGPYRFLLDTGSVFTILSPETALACTERGGLSSHVLKPVDIHGGEVEVYKPRRCESLQVGGVEFRGLDCQVMDLQRLADAGVSVDGVLGSQVFVGACLTVDYRKKQVLVSRAELESVDGSSVFALTGSYAPQCDLRLGDESFRVGIDTGAEVSVLLDRLPDASALDGAGSSVTPLVGFGGPSPALRMVRLGQDVQFGGSTLERPIVTVGKGVGVIGVNVLSKFRVVLDFANRRFALRDGPRRVRFPSRFGTGAYMRSTETGWVLSSVIPGSAADAAGLRVGDRVSSVNGALPDTREWTVDVAPFEGKSGSILRFEVLRDGAATVIPVPVSELVR